MEFKHSSTSDLHVRGGWQGGEEGEREEGERWSGEKEQHTSALRSI